MPKQEDAVMFWTAGPLRWRGFGPCWMRRSRENYASALEPMQGQVVSMFDSGYVRQSTLRCVDVGKAECTKQKMNKEWQDATRQGNIEKVRLLLDNGVDVNSKDEHSQTALMHAAHAGQVELVRLLIEKGAELNTTAKYKLSALMLAIIGRHAEVAQLLIEAGADLSIRSSRSFLGITALALAEDSGQSQIVALLKEKGATK